MDEEKVNEIESTNKEKVITVRKSDIWKYSTFLLLAVIIVFGIIHFSGNGNVTGGATITGGTTIQPDSIQQNSQTILECAEDYGLNEDSVIFYYSDSCGWCSKMKPGVALLNNTGYNIYYADASKQNPLISNCVLDHMTSGGVPQFVCVKTGEIRVGAFADSQGNLDQLAMNAWFDNCLA